MDEAPASAGNIEYIEQCRDCGMERRVQSNGSHHGYGRWGESRAKIAAREAREAKEVEAREDISAARLMGVESVSIVDGVYYVTRRGETVAAHEATIRAACSQGDATLARVYRGVRRLAGVAMGRA